MKKSNFYTDNPDIEFHLKNRGDFETMFNWLSDEEKEALSVNSAEEYQNTWAEVMEGYGDFCGGQLAQNAEQVEKEDIQLKDGEVVHGPTMQSNIQGAIEQGVPGLSVELAYGGMEAPFAVEMTGAEMSNRACPSTVLSTGWWGPIAHIIEHFASDELKEEYIPKIASGEISGNMALTEAGAGSDLSAIATYGEEQEDGTWIINGSKRFISNGNSEISLVLAKNKKGAKDLKDLSLYICPRFIDGKENIQVTKIEEKIGLHGSATCELIYDNAKAYLLGKNGEGFHYMLRLMNDSRIAVAFQGLGLMEATYRLANEYAHERKTWDKPIAHHEAIAERLLDMDVETKAFRSLCYQAAFNQSLMYAGEKYLRRNPDLPAEEKKQVEKKISKYNSRVRRWTPLMKWWAGEKSFLHAREGVQIHGGYGFTKEYRAEWWVRESLIYSLYEGTSQIQALMCMKDTLKYVVRNPVEFMEIAFGLKVRTLSESDKVRRKLYQMKEIAHRSVISVMYKLLKSNVKDKMSQNSDKDMLKMVKLLSKDLVKFENIQPALLHAERITEMKTLVSIAEAAVWDIEADPEREWIAERFINKALPRLNYLKSLIDMDDPVLEKRLKSYAEADA